MSTPNISASLLSQAGADLTGPQSASGSSSGSRVHKAAQQFEALLIGEMMKTVREGGSGGWLGSGDETGDDTAIGMAESQFSQAMASQGGLGLARVIEHNVSREQENQNDKAMAEKLSIGS